jgi:NAD(P)-dependent dehydrogenase (short-subunit alcohol dehydrogenase family)
MTGRLEGRRAVVTGASRGIGAGIAERLAAEGAHVVLTARTVASNDRLPGSLTETRARLERYGGVVGLVAADLTDEEQRSRLIPAAQEILGGHVEILVNNAAAAIPRPIETVPAKAQRLILEANVVAPLTLTQAVIPAMRAAGAGWVVNLSSAGAGLASGPPFRRGAQGSTMDMYSASKAALNRVTNGLAVELYGTGIRVNTIQPRVAVMSEGMAKLGHRLDSDAFESLEQIVEATVALCDCPEDVTGQVAVSSTLIAQWGLEIRGLDGLPLPQHVPGA